MTISIPDLSLVVLVGASGSGKSTFARRHFKPTEVLSSDVCRGLVADDENDQTATPDAFDVLHYIAAKRLAAGRLTVIDATNVQASARKSLVELARRYHCRPVAIVLDLPERICAERNAQRADRQFGAHVLRLQTRDLRRALGHLKREGFRHVHVLETPEQVEAAAIVREPLWNNRTREHGPFDIIGDIHGCCTELEQLLGGLGYLVTGRRETPGWEAPIYRHPDGRTVIFLGDLVDRGPRILDTVRLVKAMVDEGTAMCVPGNHDMKLVRALRGRNVQMTHGLDRSLAEIAMLPDDVRESFKMQLGEFLDGLISHYLLDDGRLVVAHAGMKETMQGRGSREVREFALFGETTGELDEYGLPVRHNWAADYRGPAMVVYGHTPVAAPEWLNRTINIDTGCVFGGQLTALRYPERELASVAAMETYHEPVRPLKAPPEATAISQQQQHDEVLDVADVMGKRVIQTRLQRSVTIQAENAAAAIEVMSRFAIDPRWLVYLPPTMAPTETSKDPGLLEHPADAFAYYRSGGAPLVVCEEKHMGSRAIVVLCRDEGTARRRFGVRDGAQGVCYTRTGRRFFDNLAWETELLARLREAMTRSGLWEELATDWICLDAELLPWSAKARDLLRLQYAATGAAAGAALAEAIPLLCDVTHMEGARAVLDQCEERSTLVSRYVDAYRRYSWPVASLSDLKLAPFHLMASEGAVHVHKDHRWHIEMLRRLRDADTQLLLATTHLFLDASDPADEHRGVAWWRELTDAGGEGMVVKPLSFVAHGKRGLLQPAVKCRGAEYLRLVYGPEYTAPANLERLRSRNVSAKRSLALREFALGVEALERFVQGEPLRRIHECVFGVLALESEPVDPRL